MPPPPPPPPPGAAQSQEAVPPAETSSSEALLLVRAMIAAANADHEVDDKERAQILRGLDAANCSAEERQFLLAEIEAPMGIDHLASKASSPDLARQVYLASLMAIDVNTPAEEAYLERLAAKLGLSATDVDEIEGML